MGEKKDLLFLYAELAGYLWGCLDALVTRFPVTAHVVHWPVSRDAPFRFRPTSSIRLYPRDQTDGRQLRSLFAENPPEAMYVLGWMDHEYLKIARRARRQGIPVIGGLDTRWRGTLRQRALVMTSRLSVQRCFSHLWVAGSPQDEYARRLGFPPSRVLNGLYSATIDPFRTAYHERSLSKASTHPRELLYVGRLIPAKGVATLYEVFHRLAAEGRTDWHLRIVGAGPLAKDLPSTPACTVQPFVQPEALPLLVARAGAFVLPSIWEPWGVVLHEAAAAGLPLLASDACGSATAFLRDGENGFQFRADDTRDLEKALIALFTRSDAELRRMGDRSAQLALQITPETWARTLYDVAARRETN